MRKFLLLILLASASTPALAAPDDDSDRPNVRSPRPERSEPRAEGNESRTDRSVSRPQRIDRADRPERNFSGGAERPRSDRGNGDTARAVFVRPDRADRTGSGAVVSRPEPVVEQPSVRGPGERFVGRRPAGDTVREWRRSERADDNSPSSIEDRNLRRAPRTERGPGGLVERRASTPRIFDPNNGPRRISRTPQFGTEPPPPATFNRDRQSDHRRWRGDWRRDHRYDWRDHRRHHRSTFHLGFYLDPFGWDYARYGIGWRLWPSYYSSRYWLNDSWQYRLPPAYGPYRWVRYYDDALLVNIYTGEVVDVEYNFFW
jgi:Ni/Co efflux regulator RcnB